MPDSPTPEADISRADRALDATNSFPADVRDGLGPYLAIYLLTGQHRDEARIGIVMSIAALAGIAAPTPAGGECGRQRRLPHTLGAIAAIGFIVFLLALPGTAGHARAFSSRSSRRIAAR